MTQLDDSELAAADQARPSSRAMPPPAPHLSSSRSRRRHAAGEVPPKQVVGHQRLRRRALDEIVEISEEAGMYELTSAPATTR